MPLTNTATHPAWFHSLGRFVYRASERDPHTLTFTSKSAHLKISKGHMNGIWQVRWIIFFGRNVGRVDGHRNFFEWELRALFNLLIDKADYEKIDWDLVHLRGASLARKGLFITKDGFANVPCPGTGMDGDPNISFRITQVMREKVAYFIQNGTMSAV